MLIVDFFVSNKIFNISFLFVFFFFWVGNKEKEEKLLKVLVCYSLCFEIGFDLDFGLG